MRYLGALFFAIISFAQTSATSTRLPDLNGGFTVDIPMSASAKTPTSSSRMDYAPGVNGAMIPRESVEEKVIRQDANGRVLERVVRRYDTDGNQSTLEKTVIEEKKSGGTLTTSATVYRGDFNGNLQMYERSRSETVTQGAVTTAGTTIERAGMDGQLAPAERVNATTIQRSSTSQQQTVTRLRRDASGNFYEAVKETRDVETQNGQMVENRAQYVAGKLTEQAVSRTVPGAGGSTTTTVDVFTPQGTGLFADPGGRLALREQQQISRVPGTGGQAVVETVVSRKPTAGDATVLGAAQIVSKTVCRGSCNNQP